MGVRPRTDRGAAQRRFFQKPSTHASDSRPTPPRRQGPPSRQPLTGCLAGAAETASGRGARGQAGSNHRRHGRRKSKKTTCLSRPGLNAFYAMSRTAVGGAASISRSTQGPATARVSSRSQWSGSTRGQPGTPGRRRCSSSRRRQRAADLSVIFQILGRGPLGSRPREPLKHPRNMTRLSDVASATGLGPERLNGRRFCSPSVRAHEGNSLQQQKQFVRGA